MKPQDKEPSLKTLEDNIRQFQRKTAPKTVSDPPQGAQAALRVGLELASGVLVGAIVGIYLDKWLGTSPVMVIICLALGAGGGFLTIYRTMQAMDKEVMPPTPAPMTADDEDE